MSSAGGPRPVWATVGRMSSPGFTSLSLANQSPTQEDDKGLRASVATSSPRLLEYGSPGRGGGSGLGSLGGSKSELDIIRFFTARDILDLINNLQKSAKIAAEEASSLHGNEQANRIKAKCSKVCGLANRLIDLYVATIKAKVARILRKLGLGQSRGQELLYSHLILLQSIVDKAFAAFNAVQHAEAARIKQAKLGDGRRDSSATLTWRTPAERKPGSRPGSLGSLPQPAQHMDVRDLLLDARKHFIMMADELVDLKNKLIVFDRSRIHDAVVAAVAEGDVPDPLPKVKATTDGVAYGFNTRYVSDGGCSSTISFGRCTSQRAVADTAPGSPSLHSPRTSRLARCSLEALPAVKLVPAVVSPRSGLRSVSVPGDAAPVMHPRSPVGMVQPHVTHGVQVSTPRSRMVISHGGCTGYTDSGSPASRQATARDLFREGDLRPSPQPDMEATFMDLPIGAATCHVALVGPSCQKSPGKESPFGVQDLSLAPSSPQLPMLMPASAGAVWAGPGATTGPEQLHTVGTRAPLVSFGFGAGLERPLAAQQVDVALSRMPSGSGKRLSDAASLEVGGHGVTDEAAASPEALSRLQLELQARTATTEILSMQAARVGQQLVRLTQETEDGRLTLRELALEALRLVRRDPQAMEASLIALDISQEQLAAASSRCQDSAASGAHLQSLLRTCLTLLGEQLRAQASQPYTMDGSATGPSTAEELSSSKQQQSSCTRCGELAALLDQVVPLLHAAATGDRTATADLGSVSASKGLTELASDGSQDEVVLLPVAAELDAPDAGEKANEAMVTVLQRLNVVLDRMQRLEEESAEMEQTLANERQGRTDAEAQAARLQADNNETSEALVCTQRLLYQSERQLQQMREDFAKVNQELDAKAVEITQLQQQLLQIQSPKCAISSPQNSIGLFGMNMLTATEMELEGLRVEHENLRSKTELQGTEVRQLQNEVSGLRAARDKLVDELQEMQAMLQQREDANAAAVEDVSLVALKTRGTPDGKAAARAASRGVLGAAGAGFSTPGKECSGSRTSAPGAALRSPAITSPTATKSKAVARQGLHTSIGSLSSVLRSPGSSAAPRAARKSIPASPGLLHRAVSPTMRRSVSSSGASTPRDHFCAVARLEEVQVQLAQVEAEKRALECQLQAAQSVIATRDSELDMANLMLLEFERRSIAVASTGRKPAPRLSSSVNGPLLQFLGDPFGTPGLGGDAMAVLAITPSRAVLSNGDAANHATTEGSAANSAAGGTSQEQDDLLAKLEDLQAQCEELIKRSADLDSQRSQAQLDAEERAAELQATKEYIQELEEEAELLRGLADQATMQMHEKEQDVAAQERALFDAREALARAQEECAAQINLVETQAAELEQAQAQLEAAQARVLELEAHDEEQSRADAEALARIGEEVVRLEAQHAATWAALAAANTELSVARASAEAAERAADEVQQAYEDLHARALASDAQRMELMHKLTAAEKARSGLEAQLADALVDRQDLAGQLEAVIAARKDTAAMLANKEAALAETLDRLERCEASRQHAEAQLQMEGATQQDLRASLALLKMEQVDLQRQVANDRSAVKDMAEKLGETEVARLELAAKLDNFEVACRDLQEQLAEAKETVRDEQVRLEEAVLAKERTEQELEQTKAKLETLAAELATAAAEMDGAHCRASAADAERQQMQERVEHAEAAAQQLFEQVRVLEQQLQSAQEQEARMQEQASAYAAARAAEAEAAVAELQAALADVTTRLESLRAEAAAQAAKVATLEAALAQAGLEQERLVIQAATAAAHSQMLEEQLRQAKEENVVLEQELAKARAEIVAQDAASVLQADELASVRAANLEQEQRFAEETSAWKAQLVAAVAANKELTEKSANQIAELEAQIAAARAESERQTNLLAAQASSLEVELADARAALETQAQQSVATVRALEDQLAEAQSSYGEQAKRYRALVEDLEDKLASARSAISDHAARASAQVEELEAELAAARASSEARAEQSAAQVAGLLEQLIAARGEMAEQAHTSAARAAELEAELAAARSAVSTLVERSNLEVSDLVGQLEAARETCMMTAKQSAETVSQLEARLTAAQAEHAELAECSANQVAELEARLVATLAGNTEQAKRSAAQAAELEAQLAAAMAMASEQAAVQTAELSAQLAAARAELSEKTQRSSADAAQLVQQLEAAHAAIAAQIEHSAAQTEELEQQLSAAREDNRELVARSAGLSAQLEAQIAAAQAENMNQQARQRQLVTDLEHQLHVARGKIAEQLKRSSVQVEALEEQLVMAHNEYAGQSERAAAQIRELEAQLAAAQAAIAEQVQGLTAKAAALEVELESARAETHGQAAHFKSVVVELEARLAEARVERKADTERHAVRVAELEAQLAASADESARHASRAAALAASFNEQIAAAREASAAQSAQMSALEDELRRVLSALDVARASQDKATQDVMHLRAAELEQKKALELRQAEAQQLKEDMEELQAALWEREADAIDREVQLRQARDELQAALGALSRSTEAIDRLQEVATSATEARVAAATAMAVASVNEQQASLDAALKERARLEGLLAELGAIAAGHSQVVSDLQLEVAALQAAQKAAAAQLDDARQHAARQDAVVAELRRELAQRQEEQSAAAVAASKVHAAEVAAAELAGEEAACTPHWDRQCEAAQEAAGRSAARHSAEQQRANLAAAQRRAEDRHAALVDAEQQLAAAQDATSQAVARQRAAEADDRVLQELRAALAALEAQVSERRHLSSTVREQTDALASELTGVQKLLERQQGSTTGLLESLTAKLAEADGDMRDARARVADLQSKLADAMDRMAAAEQAASVADAEKQQVEARLTAAIADADGGRAMVQELTAELARYREEVERVRVNLIAKQTILDQHSNESNSQQEGQQPVQLRQHSQVASRADADNDSDDELVDEFLEGCIWGMGLRGNDQQQQQRLAASGDDSARTGLLARNTGAPARTADRDQQPSGSRRPNEVAPLDNGHHQPAVSGEDEDDVASALRLRALGSNVLELMSMGWHGSRLAALEAAAAAADGLNQSAGGSPRGRAHTAGLPTGDAY